MLAEKVLIKNSSTLKGHIDGEPVSFENDIIVSMDHLSLNVIVAAQ